MRLSHFSISYIAILVGIIALTLAVSWNGIAQNGQSSLSGRVVDTDGNPVSRLGLAVKSVEINMGQEIGPLAPLESWQRAITDEEGRFSISNIDPVSSRLVMFPEHGSRFEIVSVQIGGLTFRYYEVSGTGFPPWLGQLTFAIEPGTSLEDVVVKVKSPGMRIRGRVLLKDRTPLANAEIDFTVRDRRRRYEGFFPFRRVVGGGGGISRSHTWTDAQGYFVTYNIRGANKEYSVAVRYEGASAESRWVHLKRGERYDKFVLRLNDLDEHRENRNKREKARQAVWMINPENDHAYKKIACDSWADAKAKAETEGAYLVAINDASEQKWLEAVYPEKAFFWIGLRVPEKAASWQWDSGEPLTYVNWGAAGRPDSTTDGVGEIPIALIFALKKWMAIDSKSPLRPAVKHAILEKEHYF
ncbi:hypothetical protein F4054_04255 [Candidatus Poribacteria bacterium]|nr:hypothetical protein [Candidatus Poribacteria bacterium]MYG08882.1 hypothetical protein [Candidatus Poribacteria bacterium]MYK21456.1 hypothetical protein [Candidatus Poribacteria bacterium]